MNQAAENAIMYFLQCQKQGYLHLYQFSVFQKGKQGEHKKDNCFFRFLMTDISLLD